MIELRSAYEWTCENCSLVIYRDEFGGMRAHFSRKRQAIGELATTNLEAVHDWLVAWWPQLSEGGVS